MQERFLKILDRFTKSKSNQDFSDLCECAVDILSESINNLPIVNAIDYLIRKATKSDKGLLIAENSSGEFIVDIAGGYRFNLKTKEVYNG